MYSSLNSQNNEEQKLWKSVPPESFQRCWLEWLDHVKEWQQCAYIPAHHWDLAIVLRHVLGTTDYAQFIILNSVPLEVFWFCTRLPSSVPKDAYSEVSVIDSNLIFSKYQMTCYDFFKTRKKNMLPLSSPNLMLFSPYGSCAFSPSVHL